jgi:prepilin-type N-terminal cleavage/methylation domain-containing protein
MRSPLQRGFTLLEVLVAVGASAIVLAGVVVAVHSQQRAYHGGQRTREAQGSARNALLFMEQKLSAAGFGMDPALALDFAWYCPGASGTAPCPRDSVGDFDQIVLYARNPNYWIPDPELNPTTTTYRGRVWDVVGFDATSDEVTVRARQGDVFRKGQIYQAVCRGGAKYAYVTAAATVGKAGGPPVEPLDADGEVTLTLEQVGDGKNPFRRQDVARNSSACFSATDPASRARLFQIDRSRFYVRKIDLGGGRIDPYLVLDTGTDMDRDGVLTAADEQILADGIETLQVAYAFTSAIDDAVDSTLPPVGLTAGTGINLGAGLIAAGQSSSADRTAAKITTTDFAAPSPLASIGEAYSRSSFFPYTFGPPLPAERRTNHQGNIRSVELSVVARSATPDPDVGGKGALPGAAGFTVLNMNATPSWIATPAALRGHDGYERIRFDTTVNLPNMVNRRMLDQ